MRTPSYESCSSAESSCAVRARADARAPTEAVALRWEHTPGRALFALALPITFSGLSFASMGVVDALLVGRLGAAQLAGVGLGLVVTNGLMGFGFGVLRGVKVLLAQAVAIHQTIEALALAGHGVLRGVGAARLSALCALGCAWLCTPWLGYLLVHVAGFGALGAWLARAFEFACAATIVWRHLASGRWQRAHLRPDPPALELASSRAHPA